MTDVDMYIGETQSYLRERNGRRIHAIGYRRGMSWQAETELEKWAAANGYEIKQRMLTV